MAIAGAIKLWLDGRGTTQYEMLADIEFSKWCMSRAMPDIKVILTFKDLATIMIKIAPSLKLSHSCTYDALILVHKTYHNLTGTNIYKSARYFSPLLRKPLLWYRALAIYEDKRRCVFKMSNEDQIRAALEIADCVERGDSDGEAERNFDITPRNRKPVKADEKHSASSSKSSDDWFGKDEKVKTPMQSPRDIGWGDRSDACDELDTDSWFGWGGSSNASDELEKCFSELESLTDAPQKPALTRRSSWDLKPKIVTSWNLQPKIVASKSTSSFDGCLDMLCNGAEASSSAVAPYKPLNGTSGNLQRNLTLAYKKAGASKPKSKAATPKGKEKTPPASKVGSISYETKKRKCTASKHAVKVALDAGATKEESRAAGRSAYADCP